VAECHPVPSSSEKEMRERSRFMLPLLPLTRFDNERGYIVKMCNNNQTEHKKK